jgi:hypothetical protein
MDTVKFSEIKEKILTLRGQKVILDSDVATLYEVATKEVNQAVKNNPNKFPQGYIFEIDNEELANLRSKILTANISKTRVQKSLMKKGGEIIADILGDDLKATDTETSIELNFAVLKFKHIIKRKQ